MSTKQTEALKLALEALEELKYSSSSHAADDIYYKAITAIREALAESALERMAKNERELGLDYMVQPAQDKEPCGWRMKHNGEWAYSFTEDAWDFIRRVPKAQQQEPVAKMGMYEHKCPNVTGHRGPSFVCQKAGHGVGQNSYCKGCACPEALNTPQQPAQQELEELTAQRDKLADILTRTANALKGQPAELSSHSWHDLPEVAQQIKAAQQQQEPVAYIHRQGNHWEVSERILLDDEKARGWTEEPLYTSPPASKPLTDDEIERIYDRYGGNMMNCARAIERAHGIKEKNA